MGRGWGRGRADPCPRLTWEVSQSTRSVRINAITLRASRMMNPEIIDSKVMSSDAIRVRLGARMNSTERMGQFAIRGSVIRMGTQISYRFRI